MQNEKTIDLSGINAVVWDFDGVFYDYDAVFGNGASSSAPITFFDDAAERALREIIPEEGIEALARGPAKNEGTFHPELLARAAVHGMDEQTLKQRLHARFNQIAYAEVWKQGINIMHADSALTAGFQVLAGQVQHGILTHGSIQSWVKPLLARAKLFDFFNERAILDLGHFGFHSKRTSPAAVGMILERLGLAPAQVAFVEDSPANLAPAKQAFPDLLTVFKKSAGDNGEMPAHADLAIRRPLDFLRMLQQRVAPVSGLH
jgi:phosphoglycolate phosphatase-like HAD superfamily hydrolase